MKENVAYVLRDRGTLDEEQIDTKVDRLLEMVGIRDESERYPSEISEGMRRAVAIARAVALGPEAVLYDEPNNYG